MTGTEAIDGAPSCPFTHELIMPIPVTTSMSQIKVRGLLTLKGSLYNPCIDRLEMKENS